MKEKYIAVILPSNMKVRRTEGGEDYIVDLHTSRLNHVATQGYKLISVDDAIAYFEYVGGEVEESI
jgi:hypothetical protein